ncbi:MAG TPA: carboxypeptidase regulatory-like domain-containing protein [Candidatus Saccharimonadales bacterium]|jgi:hypothetical protein|nr:carboxypeptidase regulatory-like domain-containing protein [Candidatus Saccharimonadales bacterium]
MKRCLTVVGLCLLCALPARAQVPVSVGYLKKIHISVPGATAAYSLDPNIAEASADNGTVEIQGRAPGSTNLIVVTSAGVQTLAVTVPQPPPSYPPGFVPPATEGNAAERGSYEVRYNSDPSQLTNSLLLMRTQGDSFDRLQVVNATLFSARTGSSQSGFPLASYELSRPTYDVTLVDQIVKNSPMTVDGFAVRGLHLRLGKWDYHAGFTSIATFQDLFLATDPEYVAGISRTFSLHRAGSLEANYFYFQNTGRQRLLTPSGGVGSIVYRLKFKDKGLLMTEAGESHLGFGFAASGNFEDKKSRVAANFRILPRRFASLAVSNQRGTFSALNASRELTQKLFAAFNLNQTNFNLPGLRQNTFVTDSSLNLKLSRHFAISGGAAYSRFSSLFPAGPTLRTLNLPAGIDFSSRHFGTGFQYQRSTNFDSTGGNDYSFNVRGSAGRLLMNASYRHDVQVPTLGAILAQVPGLQDLLERAGLVVTTPADLAQLLQNGALLSTLGFSTPFMVNFAPVRNDFNASVGFSGNSRSHPQLSASYFDSHTGLVLGGFRFQTASLSYSQRISESTDIVASASLVRSTSGPSAPFRPVYSLSLRHRFASVPSILLPGRHGEISGHVFRDEQGIAQYRNQQAGIGNVEIRLDDSRTTHTDRLGYYHFRHVPFGVHQVEAKFQNPEPFFYTTDSPATTDMNGIIDFGVAFTRDQVFGYLLNDAGAAIPGVTVELKKAGSVFTAQTTSDGKFSFPGLEPGEYSIATQPATYPPGYSLQDLQDQHVLVEKGKPASLSFTVKALRAISGLISGYDQALLQNVPLPGLTVRIKELSLETVTGANGAYIFRNLPAGVFTVSIVYHEKEVTRTVVVPSAPANLREINLAAGAK